MGAILADLALAVHRTPPPEVFATGALALIERLPPENGLCHGDLHSGNVIMTAEGPRLIDWTGAVRAPAAYDLAALHVLPRGIAPRMVADPERPRAVESAVRSEYARLAGVSPPALTADVQACLPIACVSALLGGAVPSQRERLIEIVEAAPRSEGAQAARWARQDHRDRSVEPDQVLEDQLTPAAPAPLDQQATFRKAAKSDR